MAYFRYRTYSDYGDTNRQVLVSQHRSLASAQKAFKRIRQHYSFEGNLPTRENWRCWQEDLETQQIVNDTQKINRLIYA